MSYMNNSTVVQRAVDYIEAHIDGDLSLDKIADSLHYSKFYIARIFIEETKCTVYKYIQGRRLTLAAQKLAETEQPYPKQSKIRMMSSLGRYRFMYYFAGGKFAA